MTEAQASLQIGFEKWERELNQWVTRVTRHDSHLYIEWSTNKVTHPWPWLVKDRANGDEIMLAAPSLGAVCAWMLRYTQENPRTVVDEEGLIAARDHVLHSRRVDGSGLRLVGSGDEAGAPHALALPGADELPSSGEGSHGAGLASLGAVLPGWDELLGDPRRSRA